MLKKILFIIGDGRRLAWMMLAFVAASMLELIGIGVIMPYLAFLGNPEHPGAVWIDRLPLVSDARSRIVAFSLLLILIYVVKNVALYHLQVLVQSFIFQTQQNLRKRLFSLYLHLPYRVHLRRSSSGLIDNVTHCTSSFTEGMLKGLMLVVTEAMFLVLLLVMLAVTYPAVLLLLLGPALVVLGLYTMTSPRVTAYGRTAREHNRLLTRTVIESLGNLVLIRLIGREREYCSAAARHIDEIAENERRFHSLRILPYLLLEVVALCGFLGFVLYHLASGAGLVDLLPVLGGAGIATLRMIPAVGRINSGLLMIRHAEGSIDSLYHDLAKYPEARPAEPSEAGDIARLAFREALRVRDLSFSYDGEHEVLRSLNFTLRKGQVVAIFGPSGSGKSTFLQLLLGLLDAPDGGITVDGQPLPRVLRSWQRGVTYVPQTIFLGDASIKANIAMSGQDGEIDQDRMRRVVRAARLDELIDALPQGLDSEVGENGIALSGGQRQRIAIARALYHQPEVLVLDEATSSLDAETERVVLEGVRELHAGKTLLMVSHRPHTLGACDALYRLEQGRIMPCGGSSGTRETAAAFE